MQRKIGSCFNETYFRDLDINGEIIHQKIKRRKGRKPLVGIKIDNPEEEYYFESISLAAKKLGTDRGSIEKCIQGSSRYSVIKGYILRELDINGNIISNNININDRIKKFNEANPIINGERHSLKEWFEIYNITRACYYARRKKGMNIREAITVPKRR